MTANARRSVLLIAAGALVVGGSALGIASPAQAHNYLVASTPQAGQTLAELPGSFEITTNEPLLTVGGSTNGFAFQVVDTAGLHYETGCLAVAGATMTTEPRLGASGAYTVLWQVVSADGHTVSGEIPFTWAPAAGTEPAVGSETAPACGDPLPEASPAAPSAAPSESPVVPEPDARDDTIPLADVLWVGGALLAVGLAVGVTIVIAGRRRRG